MTMSCEIAASNSARGNRCPVKARAPGERQGLSEKPVGEFGPNGKVWISNFPVLKATGRCCGMLCLLLIVIRSSASVASPATPWSSFEESNLTWPQAKRFCESRRMRLPTGLELKAASQNGIMKRWKSLTYWTNQEAGPGQALAYRPGLYIALDKDQKDGVSVRCHSPEHDEALPENGQ